MILFYHMGKRFATNVFLKLQAESSNMNIALIPTAAQIIPMIAPVLVGAPPKLFTK